MFRTSELSRYRPFAPALGRVLVDGVGSISDHVSCPQTLALVDLLLVLGQRHLEDLGNTILSVGGRVHTTLGTLALGHQQLVEISNDKLSLLQHGGGLNTLRSGDTLLESLGNGLLGKFALSVHDRSVNGRTGIVLDHVVVRLLHKGLDIVDLCSSTDKSVLQKSQLAVDFVHLSLGGSEMAAETTCCSQQHPQLGEEERVVDGHGQLNVAGMTLAEPVVEITCGAAGLVLIHRQHV